MGLITKHETELAIAIGHAAEGRLIVDRQRELVATLKARGHPVANHERTLALFEMTLRAFAEHVCLLRRELPAESKRPDETILAILIANCSEGGPFGVGSGSGVAA